MTFLPYSIKKKQADADSKLAVAAIGSWVEKARLLVLHKLGYPKADRKTLSTDWHHLIQDKKEDKDLDSSFKGVILQLFNLKSFEWGKISRDFYNDTRHTTVHKRPPAEKALMLVAQLPSPFNNRQFKELFEKLITSVDKQVDNTEEDVCA